MPITNISRDWGVQPSIVRVTSTDNLATITAPMYLTSQLANIESIQHGVFQWTPTDLVAIVYAGGSGQFLYDSVNNTFAPNTFQANTNNLYMINLNMYFDSVSEISIIPGSARDSANVSDITLTNAVDVNAAINGLNGLDTGALVANRFYAVFVIGSSSSEVFGGLMSLSNTNPLLPAGYNIFRRIGYVLTDNTSQIIQFLQVGSNRDKRMWYLNSFRVLTNGTSPTPVAVHLSAAIPNFYANFRSFSVAINATFQVQLTPAAAGNSVLLRPSGYGSNSFAIMSGDVAGVVHVDNIDCPVTYNGAGSMSVDYEVAGSVSLFVVSYVDPL